MQYAGITTADLDTAGSPIWRNTTPFTRPPPTSAPAYSFSAMVRKTAEIVTLWEDPAHNGSADVLTLRKDGDRWLILSHQSEVIEN